MSRLPSTVTICSVSQGSCCILKLTTISSITTLSWLSSDNVYTTLASFSCKHSHFWLTVNLSVWLGCICSSPIPFIGGQMDYLFCPMLTMESRAKFHGVILLSNFNALRDSAMEFHVIQPWNHVKFHTFPPFLTNSKPTIVLCLSATGCVQVHVWLNKTTKFHACTTKES